MTSTGTGVMSAVEYAWNFRPPLRRDVRFRLQSKPGFGGAIVIGKKPRFTVMCVSNYSYDVHKSRADARNGRGGGGDEFGRILSFEEVMKKTEAKGVTLPLDMFEAAKSPGIHELFLRRYLDLQGLGCGMGFAMRSCSVFRNRMMIDPWFLAKFGAQLGLDTILNIIIASGMQLKGKTSEEIVSRLWSVLFSDLVIRNCIVAPLTYACARLVTPVSQGFMGRFRFAWAIPPPYNIWFEGDRSALVILGAYSCAVVFLTGLLVLYYGGGNMTIVNIVGFLCFLLVGFSLRRF